MSQERSPPRKYHEDDHQEINPEIGSRFQHQTHAEENKDNDNLELQRDINQRQHSRERSGSRNSRRISRDRSPSQIRDERRANSSTQIYVGGISRNITGDDLKLQFEKFGVLNEVIMKGKYAFIDFKDEKDAAVAVTELHNTQLDGLTLKVEHTRKNAGGTRGGRSGPQDKDVCWKCGDVGHWSNECGRRGGDRRDAGRDYRRRSNSRERRRSPNRYQQRRSSRSDSRENERREGRCFGCKQRGHIKAHCPERGGGGRDTRDRYDDRRRDNGRDSGRVGGYYGGRDMARDRDGGRDGGRDGNSRRYISRSRSPIRERRGAQRDYSDRQSRERKDYSPRDRSPRRYERNISRSPAHNYQ